MWPLVLYGVGDILGAGIYGLVGKAAGQMGNATWMTFMVSMIAASFTGLSYASLGSRYPRAGGAAYVTHKAFKSGFLAYVVGLAVLASGLTSMATACRVFAGYFSGLFPQFPETAIIIGFAIILATIIFIGIRETIWTNSFLAIVEICGLLFIIFMGASSVGHINYLDATTVRNPTGDLTIPLLLGGAVLTFYSFVGFEDILNISEEVVEPKRTLPKGLILSIAISSLIYISISIVAVSVIPATELALSKQPLVDVIGKAAPWFPPGAFSLIALLAVSNTALLNYVMGSRLLYGMSTQGLLPKFLAGVHPKRLTPHRAILILLVVLLILALNGDISDLARATSVLLLICFSLMNLALILLQRKDKEKGNLEVPAFVPAVGLFVCIAMLTQAKSKELLIAGTIIFFIALLYFFVKPSSEAIAKMDI
ncbi:MAG: amino acid permease [Methylococcales bacterium]|nr:amino acid permease [Methylococcales bacterium]